MDTPISRPKAPARKSAFDATLSPNARGIARKPTATIGTLMQRAIRSVLAGELLPSLLTSQPSQKPRGTSNTAVQIPEAIRSVIEAERNKSNGSRTLQASEARIWTRVSLDAAAEFAAILPARPV